GLFFRWKPTEVIFETRSNARQMTTGHCHSCGLIWSAARDRRFRLHFVFFSHSQPVLCDNGLATSNQKKPKAAIPHHTPTRKKLGEPVKIAAREQSGGYFFCGTSLNRFDSMVSTPLSVLRTIRAATPSWLSSSANPRSGPRTQGTFVSGSAVRPFGATTVT